MALATTMLVTSFNVVYAQDADVTTGETTVESSETSPSDATVSGVAVTNGEDAVATTSEDGKYGIVDGETWPTTSPWKATVFGSVGTQEELITTAILKVHYTKTVLCLTMLRKMVTAFR